MGDQAMCRRRLATTSERANLLFSIDSDSLELVARYCGWSLGSLRTCARRTAHLKGKEAVLRVVARVLKYQKVPVEVAVKHLPAGPERDELAAIVSYGNSARLLRIFFNNPHVVINTLEYSVKLAVCVSGEMRERAKHKMAQSQRSKHELTKLWSEFRGHGLCAKDSMLEARKDTITKAIDDVFETGYRRMCKRMRSVVLHMSMMIVANNGTVVVEEVENDVRTRIRLVDLCLEELRCGLYNSPINLNLPLLPVVDDLANCDTHVVHAHSLLSKAVMYGHPEMVAFLVGKHDMDVNSPLPCITGPSTTPLRIAERMMDADLSTVNTFTRHTPPDYSAGVVRRLKRRKEIVRVLRGESAQPLD